MHWQDKVKAIKLKELNIYDALPDENLFFSNEELEDALKAGLIGISLAGMPLRTRSKYLKENVCRTLGYSVPKTFTKSQPRFLNQNFDTYIQKSFNLQIWNESIDLQRRYAIIRIDEHDTITALRVISGKELFSLDTTGTLTQKHQARIGNPIKGVEVFSHQDSIRIVPHIHSLSIVSPLAPPTKETVLSLQEIAEKVSTLLNYQFSYVGATKERNRGGHMHVMLCRLLGYTSADDDGQFPDIKNQLIEVKLQTSPTIDLGEHSPNDEKPTGIVYEGTNIRHCDVRYVVFSARIENKNAIISGVALGNGVDFYRRFPQLKGNVVNKKIQVPLPSDFFD